MEYLEDYDFTLHYYLGKANVVADALSRKSRGVLASIVSREWQMLETMGRFGLQYIDQAQGTLRILVATPSLLGRVIELQGHDVEILSIRDRVRLGIGDEGWTMHSDGSLRYRGGGCGSPVRRSERGDPQGVPLLSFCSASRWHEDVSRSTSPILLEWDEETRRRLCSAMSHVLVGKG